MPRTRACLLTALLACGAAAADTDPERIRVEREMQQLLQDIARLQRELQSSRTEHAAEQQRLRALDLAIQDVNLEYRALAEQKTVHQAELARLETQRDEYLASIDQRLAQLAEGEHRRSPHLGRLVRRQLLQIRQATRVPHPAQGHGHLGAQRGAALPGRGDGERLVGLAVYRIH